MRQRSPRFCLFEDVAQLVVHFVGVEQSLNMHNRTNLIGFFSSSNTYLSSLLVEFLDIECLPLTLFLKLRDSEDTLLLSSSYILYNLRGEGLSS